MPSKTKAQARMFAAIAHGSRMKGDKGPSVKVAKEFNREDKKTGILKGKKK